MTESGETILSPWLGEIRWTRACELYFPAGLPGFELERRLIPVEIPSQRPLVYLQSAEHAKVCFLALPALTIDPTFALDLCEDDRAVLGLGEAEDPSGASPACALEVLCLALLRPDGPTVQTNLGAPIVINLRNGCGIQALTGAVRSVGFRLSPSGDWEAVC